MLKILAPLAGLAFIAGVPLTAHATNLTVYHAWPNHASWQTEIANRFTAEHPDVSITFQAPATDYNEGLISVIRQNLAGSAPDVFMVGSHLIRELVSRELVAPIDDLTTGLDMAALGYTPEVLAFTQVDGVQYGLPWTSSTPVMFYNADLVRQAGGDPDAMPTGWDETIALAARIQALGNGVMGMYYTPGDDDWMTQNLLANASLAPISQDGTIAFETDGGRQAMTLFERFHTEGGQTAISDTDARQQMFAGKLGLYFNSTAAVRSFEREIAGRFDWNTAVMPTLAADGGVAAGGMAAVILTDDPEKRKAAFDYVLFGTSAPNQALVVQNTGYMPVNSGSVALLADFYAEHPQFETSTEQLARAYPWFGWPGQNGARISQIVLDTMSAVANGQISGEEGAALLGREIAGQLPR